VYLKILREPTFHFLLLAAVISTAYWLINSTAGNQLQIDQQEIEARILITELTQGYPADAVQRQQIEQNLINDYLLVLEAYKLDLQNDARINDILAQKMRHVLSGNVIQPTSEELEDFYSNNVERYTSAPRVTTEELVFNTREPLPDELTMQLAQGSSPENIRSDIDQTAGILPRVTQQDLSSIFSEEFALQVFAAQLNDWIGPFFSNRGQHWLRINELFPAATAALSDITDQVRLDWIFVEEDRRLELEIAKLRDNYSINIIGQD